MACHVTIFIRPRQHRNGVTGLAVEPSIGPYTGPTIDPISKTLS
ncbi:hypothetical protein CCACVL1_07650 [Corchorus capsularis]|uniref:Uncharacterized protein n=1 Tax=Corchorus capsularis TaxID=210143 RepID=A0A1R3J4K9_COCAP|nr:hypothetical protein CCACVL1_07650 [Corchorus capsularis]